MPKQPLINGMELKSYDVLQEMHIELSTLLAFLQLELHFQSYHISKFVPIVYNNFEFVMVVCHTFEFV
jgi:hypothetical protein